MVQFSIKLPEKLLNELKVKAGEHKENLSDYVRKLLISALDNDDQSKILLRSSSQDLTAIREDVEYIRDCSIKALQKMKEQNDKLSTMNKTISSIKEKFDKSEPNLIEKLFNVR